ncbi:MAG: putative metal-dependent hydrolase, partial [Saprospiraceae bacterium]|nr:putative metal-dependent hydrolase [Saprospiraceae bacterium]
MKKINKLRYPIGQFEYGKSYSPKMTRKHIKVIARLPKDLKKVVSKLSKTSLDTPYRPGGWSVRQVIHHLADSHMNAYVRMKLTATEPTPIIKPYEEALWAETADAKGSVKESMRLLTALHARWVEFLKSLTEEDLERGYFHPERQAVVLLPEAIALYAWHSNHHLAHIELVAKKDKGEKKKASKKSKAPEAKIAEQPSEKKSEKKRKPGRPKEEASDESKKKRAEILEKARAARAAGKAEAKPKRGRPKKVEAVATEAAPTRRPGRPKKAGTAATTGRRGRPKKVEAVATEAAPTRRPGRPKKTGTTTATPGTGRRGRPKKVETVATETTPKRRPGRPKKAASDKPKMTRAEVLAKARAARAAKAGKPAAKAKKAASDKPKMTRAEVLAKARAARAAKADKPTPEAHT